MALLLNTATNPGTAVWTDASTLLVIGSPNRALSAAAALAITNPNNAWPLDLFAAEASTTITVPTTGTYLATITASITRSGALAGTTLAQSMFLNFTVNGVLMGDTGAFEAPVDLFTRPYILRQVLALTAGQLVGAQWGWGTAQVATATASNNRVLTIIPVV
jgi:hypothetical protein